MFPICSSTSKAKQAPVILWLLYTWHPENARTGGAGRGSCSLRKPGHWYGFGTEFKAVGAARRNNSLTSHLLYLWPQFPRYNNLVALKGLYPPSDGRRRRENGSFSAIWSLQWQSFHVKQEATGGTGSRLSALLSCYFPYSHAARLEHCFPLPPHRAANFHTSWPSRFQNTLSVYVSCVNRGSGCSWSLADPVFSRKDFKMCYGCQLLTLRVRHLAEMGTALHLEWRQVWGGSREKHQQYSYSRGGVSLLTALYIFRERHFFVHTNQSLGFFVIHSTSCKIQLFCKHTGTAICFLWRRVSVHMVLLCV